MSVIVAEDLNIGKQMPEDHVPVLNSCIYEYIWLDAKNQFRSKIQVLYNVKNPTQLPPNWNYDGSSTGQSKTRDTEITLKPCSLFKNPLITHPNAFLVVCETFDEEGLPLSNNHRHQALKIFEKHQSERAWYGLEQEYFLINRESGLPLGFPHESSVGFHHRKTVEPQGVYYCSNTVNQGYSIAERHLLVCLEAEVKLSGINAEVALGQWEFQVGPCEGISIGDHMLAARFFMERIAAKEGCKVDWGVKPIKGDWNGSGCHVNFSTLKMREGDLKGTGLNYIEKAIANLAQRHLEHLPLYGEGNDERLSGHHETSKSDKFTWGKGDRSASIRITGNTIRENKGYFEDRRPGSNIDPYLVSAKILASVMDEDYPLM